MHMSSFEYNVQLRLKRLLSHAAVLHVGAHPDDEDIGVLFYLTRKRFARAVYWSATRGEGGQNRINSYQENALGIFRTWESLAVRALDGGECLFGPFKDFGFCKNETDAFSKWGRNHLVRELVRAIRMVCPQVVISRWAGDTEDLHGHHQAVGQAVREAFDLAGDPEQFRDMADSGLKPWKPLKLYLSTNNAMNTLGIPNGTLDPALERKDFLRINTGTLDPFNGRTYQEQAWAAFNLHQTQGLGLLPTPDDFFYYYQLLKSHIPIPSDETDIFAGFDPTLTGLADINPEFTQTLRVFLEQVKTLIAEGIDLLDPGDPKTAAKPVLEGMKILRSLLGRIPCPTIKRLIHLKIKEFEAVAAFCLGLRLECVSTRGSVTPGESIWIRNQLWNLGNASVTGADFDLAASEDFTIESREHTSQGSNTHRFALYEVFVEKDSRLSCPYWLERTPDPYRFVVPDTPWNQKPFRPISLEGRCRVTIDGHLLTLNAPAQYREALSGGFREKDVHIFPPISIHPDANQRILLSGRRKKKIHLAVVVRSHDTERPVEGLLEIQGPSAWEMWPRRIPVHLQKLDDAQTCHFAVTIPPNIGEGRYTLAYKIFVRGRQYSVIMTAVRRGIPGLSEVNRETCSHESFILEPACVTINLITAKIPKAGRFAYVMGAAESLLATLEPLGIRFTRLSDEYIAHGKLNDFDVIVIGPLAYALRPVLKDYAHRMLTYVENGGRLIVQYQDYGYAGKGLAPYPVKYNRPNDRVTDQKAPITLLKPESPLFHDPNPIAAKDFDGWEKDRGLFFLRSWDDRYETFLACRDSNEPLQEGGLVFCRFGRGTYFYVGYSLFRQIPLGVAGAIRLFFNIMASDMNGGKHENRHTLPE